VLLPHLLLIAKSQVCGVSCESFVVLPNSCQYIVSPAHVGAGLNKAGCDALSTWTAKLTSDVAMKQNELKVHSFGSFTLLSLFFNTKEVAAFLQGLVLNIARVTFACTFA
jgi:hypothetical protein